MYKSSRNVEYKGKRTVKDLDTGEVFEIDYIKKVTDRNLPGGWRRVYLEDFLNALDEVGNKKVKICSFILSNLDSNNKLNLSITDVANKSKISYPTVHSTFSKLIEKKLLKKVGTAWVVMPNFVATFGSDKKNAMLLTEYTDAEATLFDDVEQDQDKETA